MSVLPVCATVWVAGREPQAWNLSAPPPPEGICWFDVEQSVDPRVLFEQLEPFCDGLRQDMLDDLLTPDEIPENRRWHDGTVRLASSFGVYPPEGREAGWGRGTAPSAGAVYQAVELLAGGGWLITRWHEPCLYCGSELRKNGMEAVEKDELIKDVTRRWKVNGGGNAGDLGVLAMHELALTYAPAHRQFRTALEAWELKLYGIGSEAHDAMFDHERQLRELWGARARLRDWLNPLNVSGLSRDCDKAWLPVENHEEAREVDDRVDEALQELSDLGDMLRHSFQLMHIKMSDAQRAQHEERQRRLEFLGTILLVPTLIVGFYGANTWVPGDHRHWGFWVMVAAIAILTTTGGTLVSRSNRRRRWEQSARREERLLR
jgi:hypothetical protein